MQSYNDDFIQKVNNGDIIGVLECIKKGVGVNTIVNEYDFTALMYASYIGNLELVKTLISQGADVNIKDKYGSTALMVALLQKQSEVAIHLINLMS